MLACLVGRRVAFVAAPSITIIRSRRGVEGAEAPSAEVGGGSPSPQWGRAGTVSPPKQWAPTWGAGGFVGNGKGWREGGSGGRVGDFVCAEPLAGGPSLNFTHRSPLPPPASPRALRGSDCLGYSSPMSLRGPEWAAGGGGSMGPCLCSGVCGPSTPGVPPGFLGWRPCFGGGFRPPHPTPLPAAHHHHV